MGTQPKLHNTPDEFALALFSEPAVNGRARLIAEQVLDFLPGCAVVVYVAADLLATEWAARWTCGDVEVAEGVVCPDSGTLGITAEKRQPCLFSGSDLSREEFQHIHVRRTIASIATLPLTFGDLLIGSVEVIAFDKPITSEQLNSLGIITEYGGPAIAAALRYEDERNNTLHSITRLSQLYDLEKVFNSTLEMDDLIPIITAKVQDVLSIQAVHLWLVGAGDELVLIGSAGNDCTVQPGSTQHPGEGIATEVSESGNPVLVAGEDERLNVRNLGNNTSPIVSVMAAPLISQGKLVGVLEAVNRIDGNSFTEDDLFFLTNIAETTANALQNASLLQTERKLEILQTLVHVSREITSTLNMDRVLHAIVNGPSAVIAYERATIALEQRNRMQIKAISGEQQMNPSNQDVKRLDELLQWVAELKSEVSVREVGGQVECEKPETAVVFKKYFEESGMRALHAIPLSDDEGRIGLLALESSDPDFLGHSQLEMIHVLAAQATVALRNAQLYRDVPFISVLEPLIQKKQKFMAMQKRRRFAWGAAAVASIVLLAVLPFPMRVEGVATVAPAHRALVQPENDGTVRRVYVREGQFVHRGQVLADMEDWQFQSALAAAQAKYQTAIAEMNRALAANDGTEAGVQRVQASYWQAEVMRDQQQLERTRLRSPIDGWVATPHIDTFAGRHLQAGDLFAQIEDNSQATVDVAVTESDIVLLRTGDKGYVKLDGFPARTFRGDVAILSPKGELKGDARIFYARLAVPNSDRSMRPGMEGRSKILIGWRPVGYVLFRKPAAWLYTTFWSWFGW